MASHSGAQRNIALYAMAWYRMPWRVNGPCTKKKTCPESRLHVLRNRAFPMWALSNAKFRLAGVL
eukprot:4504195-Pyramimonas_sp.AAC.1